MALRTLEFNVLRQARSLLGNDLMISRGKTTFMGRLPLCGVCGQPVRYPIVVETLIPETEFLHAHEEIRLALLSPENCSLVHPGPCYESAGTPRGRKLCARQLLEEEGLERILAWLKQVEGLIGSTHGRKSRRLLTACRQQPQDPGPVALQA